VEVLDPEIPGALVRGKHVVFDVRVVLDDGSRAILEMQVRPTPTLTGRLTYYLAREARRPLRSAASVRAARGPAERATPSALVLRWRR
jgi:hypothetical protein